MAYRPSHFGICVADLDRSLRFYRDGLGFTDVAHYALDSATVPGLAESLELAGRVRVQSHLIRRDGMTIELLAYAEPTPTGTPAATRGQLGLTHLSFLVDDVDAAAARLVDHGGTLLPSTRQAPGIAVVFLADPDGVRIELMHRPAGAL